MEPEAKIEDVSVGMQQRVEILKMLYRDAEVLIFDEHYLFRRHQYPHRKGLGQAEEDSKRGADYGEEKGRCNVRCGK